MIRLRLLLLALLLPTLARAGDFVCGDTTKLHQFTPSVDLTLVPLCPAPFVLSQLPDDEAVMTTQRDLYRTMAQAGTVRHLKVVSERMVEMTQPEKDAVDAPLLAAQAHDATMTDELMTQEYCSTKTLQQVTTKVTNKLNQMLARIDAITNLQTGKDSDRDNFTEAMKLIEQTARCVIAILELRR